MRQFTAYVFDVDGTLLDSAEDICGAIRQVLADTPSSTLQTKDLMKYVGVHLREMFRELLPGHPEEYYQELIRQYREFYPARRHKSTRVYPGVREALGTMAGRRATATTKGTLAVKAILEQFELLPYIDHVQGTDDFPYKPAPDVVFAALKALSAKPEDCLFVGDSAADMEAGRRAGVSICGVRYGYGNQADMQRWQPDYWVSDLRELL